MFNIFSLLPKCHIGKMRGEKNGERKKKKEKKPTELNFHQCDSVSKNHSQTTKARKARKAWPACWDDRVRLEK